MSHKFNTPHDEEQTVSDGVSWSLRTCSERDDPTTSSLEGQPLAGSRVGKDERLDTQADPVEPQLQVPADDTTGREPARFFLHERLGNTEPASSHCLPHDRLSLPVLQGAGGGSSEHAGAFSEDLIASAAPFETLPHFRLDFVPPFTSDLSDSMYSWCSEALCDASIENSIIGLAAAQILKMKIYDTAPGLAKTIRSFIAGPHHCTKYAVGYITGGCVDGMDFEIGAMKVHLYVSDDDSLPADLILGTRPILRIGRAGAPFHDWYDNCAKDSHKFSVLSIKHGQKNPPSSLSIAGRNTARLARLAPPNLHVSTGATSVSNITTCNTTPTSTLPTTAPPSFSAHAFRPLDNIEEDKVASFGSNQSSGDNASASTNDDRDEEDTGAEGSQP